MHTEYFLATLLLLFISSWSQARADDPEPPEKMVALTDYTSDRMLGGKSMVRGTSNVVDIMSLWKEGFQAFHPDLDLFLSADLDRKGVFAPPGDRVLIYVTTDDFLMSEIQELRDKFGYAPRVTPVFIEMLAIVVHKDNPVEFMTLSQIDAIFSRDRLTNKGGESIQEWGQVGVEGEWKRRPIAVHGRESTSSTGAFFSRKALGGGKLNDAVKQHRRDRDIASAIEEDGAAIGFGGYSLLSGDVTKKIRILPLIAEKGDPVLPTFETGRSQAYPLTRIGIVALNVKPEADVNPIQSEFVKYVLSRQGQRTVERMGYTPIERQVNGK